MKNMMVGSLFSKSGLRDWGSRVPILVRKLFILSLILFLFTNPQGLTSFQVVAECKGEELYSTGTASWYSTESCIIEGNSGHRTASGEKFTNEGLTCAMRSRDFGKYYKVTNLANNKSIIVKLTDFGPNKKLYKKGRIIDLSKGAFSQIADLDEGLIRVRIELIEQEKSPLVFKSKTDRGDK